jgi:hypothetical protein
MNEEPELVVPDFLLADSAARGEQPDHRCQDQHPGGDATPPTGATTPTTLRSIDYQHDDPIDTRAD